MIPSQQTYPKVIFNIKTNIPPSQTKRHHRGGSTTRQSLTSSVESRLRKQSESFQRHWGLPRWFHGLYIPWYPRVFFHDNCLGNIDAEWTLHHVRTYLPQYMGEDLSLSFCLFITVAVFLHILAISEETIWYDLSSGPEYLLSSSWLTWRWACSSPGMQADASSTTCSILASQLRHYRTLVSYNCFEEVEHGRQLCKSCFKHLVKAEQWKRKHLPEACECMCLVSKPSVVIR